jgi:hypothetical protein
MFFFDNGVFFAIIIKVNGAAPYPGLWPPALPAS